MLVTLGGDGHVRQADAVLKRNFRDVGDAAGNRDAGQAGGAAECTISDGGDCQAVDIGWKGHNPGRPGVSDDVGTTVGVCAVSVDAAVGICAVSVLSLHHAG